MMWLPTNCLQVNGYNCPPNTWLPNVGDAKLEPDLSTDYWYDLQKALPDTGQNLSSLSSFDIFLNAVGGEVLMSLSSTNKWPGIPGFVHIASVKNFRAKPNVKSNLILDIKSTPFQLYRLPDNDSSLSGKIPQWEMQYQVWESGNKIMQLPNCQITADGQSPDSLKPRYIRLVELSSGTWLIDSKFNEGRDPNIQVMNDLGIGEILTPDVTTEDLSAKSVHPLYYMSTFNGIQRDIREAWYMLNGNSAAPDEDSIALTSDVASLSSYLSADWNDKLRIKGFHTFGDETYYGNGTSFIVRQGGNGIAEPPTGNEFISYLNVNSFKTGILQKVADSFLSGHAGGILSALEFDEQSVSKGGDGWNETDLSGNPVPTIHMWHFHDGGADVNNPEMCDIVLRYNPERESSDKWLRYISYEDLKAKLSSDIGGGGSEGGEISADQLSAIPCWGMFAWTESTRTMGPGGCMVGRQWVNASGTGAGKADALYQVRCTINANGSYSCQVVNDASLGQAPTTTQCWIPIYEISGGKIAADYRGAFVVPAFD